MPLPPNKLRKFQHAPPISPSVKASLAMAAPESSLPKEFSWRNPADVAIVLPGASFKLTTPVNQEDCGNCWACSTITALGDRVQIALARKTPGFTLDVALPLSIAWMTSCNDYCANDNCVSGCDGADIGTALSFLSLEFGNGVPFASCLPLPVGTYANPMGEYRDKFATKLAKCQSETQIHEKCLAETAKCGACAVATRDSGIFIKSGSLQKIKDALTIKQEVYINGPVPAGYKVYPDFEAEGGYSNNDGIYIHKGPDSSDGAGFHAVVIVGWGEKIVDLNGTKSTISFWEVRNSWGTQWGDGGFWKHAMRDDKLLVNLECGMEGYQEDTYTGGVVSFFPEIRAIKKSVAVPASEKEKKTGKNIISQPEKIESSAKSFFQKYYIIITIVLVVLFFLFFSIL
jgi:Papain family cysteine protease